MKSKSRIQERKIYIILFAGNYFYIGATIQPLRSIYSSNVALRNGWTARHFEAAKGEDELPQMFLLDTITANQYTAFRCQLGWAKLLIENGFICINGDKFMQRVEEVLEDDENYLAIKYTDLSNLLSKEKSLFPNYGNERKSHLEYKQISLKFTPEEHAFLTLKARECGMTKADYIRQCCLKPNIVMLDTSALDEYIKELRKGIDEMNRIATNIYYMQQYFPSDLKSIQQFTDMVTDHYKQMVILSTELSRRIIKNRKTKMPKTIR